MKKNLIIVVVPVIAVVAGAFLLAFIFNTPSAAQEPAAVATTTES